MNKELNPSPFGNKTAELKADQIIAKAGHKKFPFQTVDEAIKSYKERADHGSGITKHFANLVIFHLNKKISIFETNQF